MLRESKLSECDSCLLVVLEMCNRVLKGVYRTTKTTRKWMSVSFASDIRFLVSGVFAEHKND